MPRPRFVLCPLLVLLAAGTADAMDREKLRQAVHLPEINITFGYWFNDQGNFASQDDLAPQPEKIRRLEKELKGDGSDAERYDRLARLYFRAHQPDRGKEARRKAIVLFRKQLAQHPDDPACALRLARALDWQEGLKEPETLVCRVLEKHPSDWHAWLLRAEILDSKCWDEVRRDKSSRAASLEEIMAAIAASPPTPEQTAVSRRYHQEALTCLDRAVALAPGTAEPYRLRAASRYIFGILEYCLRLGNGEKPDGAEVILNRAVLPDLRKGVTLEKEEYLGLGMLVMEETLLEVRDHSASKSSLRLQRKPLDSLSESCKKRVLGYLAALEQGVQNPTPHKAAEAAEVLGWLQYLFLNDPAAAEKTLRQSLRLDPSRKKAWEMLASLLHDNNKYPELVELARRHLQQEDCAWNRLFLAKAYEDLHQLDRAEQVVSAGLVQEPSSFLLRLTLADLLLMAGDDENVKRAGEILKRMRPEELSEAKCEQRRANFAFTLGVYLGLAGAPEQARHWLQQLHKETPRYGNLDKALKALDD